MEQNTETAACDLLARMMLVNESYITKKYIKENMNKFRSAIIFISLIDNEIVEGSTNQDLYDLYCKVAHDMDIEPLSLIDFSRTLCKYYGFKLSSIKKNGKTKRIFLKDVTPTKTEQIHAIQALVCYLMNVKTKEDFLGQRNLDAYEKYVDWCRDNVQPIVNKIVFSRTLCASYNISMKSAKKDGHTIRIYVELEGDDNADNSSDQESLG